MKLCDLLCGLPVQPEVRGNREIPVDALITDSRVKTENGLFFCIRGLRFDAHTFADQAEKNGCTALVVDHFVDSPLVQVKVENVRSAMAYLAGAFFDYPARNLRMVGITGTKGKTTSSYLTKAILEKAGMKVGLIGTTGNMIGKRYMESNMTTPDPVDLHRTLRQMVDEGVEAVVMEVSAHAVAMNRLDGIQFEAAAYTNLSQDHLDYFGTMDKYFETKKSFFLSGVVRSAALNADEETSTDILREMRVPAVTYGISADAGVYARDIEINEDGVSFSLHLRNGDPVKVQMHLTGMFNVYNALCSASLTMILGVPGETIRQGLEEVTNVPGRVEVLETSTPYKVILDYAHSPNALENILKTVRAFTKRRLIVLVGCGGDRDQGKRPMMGEIAGRLADYTILTSDNPRSEDPNAILRSMENGITRTEGRYTVIENRREAIRHGLENAGDGDVLILAGKGNENYQEIMGVKRPFDERLIVREILEEMQRK